MDENGKAELLNQHFCQVGPELLKRIPHVDDENFNEIKPQAPVFELKEISTNDLATEVRDLRPSTSCGVDGLTARLIKQAGPTILQPLLHVINLSIRLGIFPDSWKTGCITPLFKEGDATDPSNYRPISILPCMGKLLERIIHTQLYAYVTKYQLLSDDQSGFRKGHSTGTCLIDFLDNIYQNIDKNMYCGVLFLDLRKAFDTVDHNRLIEKLKYLGVKSHSTRWFKSYLEGRQQVTKVGKVKSSPGLVTCGIPQGSILGPLLFSIFVNDLPNCLNTESINLYADDTAISIFSKDPQELECNLNVALALLKNWFDKNKLSLNCTKSKVMYFGTHKKLMNLQSLQVKCNEVVLENVEQYKYLGVLLDSNLNFKANTEYIANKVIKRTGILGRARHFLDQHTCLYLYKQLILPLIDYADFIYDDSAQYNMHLLQILQNNASRRILKADRLTHVLDLHTSLQIDYLNVRRKKHTLIWVYKILNGLAPKRLERLFTRISEVTHRLTRYNEGDKLYIPKPRLELTKKSFRYRAATLWNNLPEYIKTAPSIVHFKSALDIIFGDD